MPRDEGPPPNSVEPDRLDEPVKTWVVIACLAVLALSAFGICFLIIMKGR